MKQILILIHILLFASNFSFGRITLEDTNSVSDVRDILHEPDTSFYVSNLSADVGDSITAAVSFYENYNSLYKIKSMKVIFGGTAGIFTAAGVFVNQTSANNVIKNANLLSNQTAGKIYYGVAGLCAVGFFICTVAETAQWKKIRDKQERITFIGNGVTINLNTQNKK